ncbi:MAG: MarR family winged helix-turn-helix transcriptional regulator [Flavobacteriales bacterium]
MQAKPEQRVLHPAVQAHDRDARIVAALERLSEVVRNLAWDAGSAAGLSPLHVQLLAFLHGHGESDVHAVELTAWFHLSKATVSVALRTLEEKGLLRMRKAAGDARAKVIALTTKGRAEAAKCAAHLDPLHALLRDLSHDQRDRLYASLFALTVEARRAGLVRVERMCVTCAHYGTRAGKPFCALLNKRLLPQEHRMDCPEHKAA